MLLVLDFKIMNALKFQFFLFIQFLILAIVFNQKIQKQSKVKLQIISVKDCSMYKFNVLMLKILLLFCFFF